MTLMFLDGNIKKICEIAIEQRDDLQFTLETFFDLVQKYYPEYDTSEKVKKVLKIYSKYFISPKSK